MAILGFDFSKIFAWAKKLLDMKKKIQECLEESSNEQEIEKIILEEISNAIDEVGLKTLSGHLKSSFKLVGTEKQGGRTIYRVISTARYASYLNDGAAPSFGRYVPAIGRRLINGSQIKMGMHPGNRPYKFMEKAEARVYARGGEFLVKQITNYIKSWLS